VNGRTRALTIASDQYGAEVLRNLLARAARGESGTAGSLEDTAPYADLGHMGRAAHSMLAVSGAAANAGDLVTGRAEPRATGSPVQTAGGADDENAAIVRMWAIWQEARGALITGDIDHALASFGSADAAASDDAAAEPIRKAGQLARRMAELRREQESHREAHAALSRAEHQVLGELLACVRAPGSRDGGVHEETWSDAPAVLKMPDLAQSGGTRSVRRRSWTSLRGMRARRYADRARVNGSTAAALPPDSEEPPVFPAGQLTAITMPLTGSRTWPARAGSERAVREGTSPRHAAPRRTTPGRVSRSGHLQAEVSVHLLGPMSVVIDDVPVDEWASARIRSLFGYLLTHRQPWPPREVLMEVFWPESSPEASRNSLNVAIHGLRRVLREAKDVPIIIYSRGTYRLHGDVRLWLDVEEFDRLVDRGRRHEDVDETDQATAAYEFATGLYRGEFLPDDPYDDWAALSRERLRLAYLDTLGRLSNLHFNAERYAASANLCQRIIEQDPCREDAHRRLMRCFTRQGQPHLALIQYRACVRALESELGVRPDLATVTLDHQIRRHEPV